MQSHPTGTTDSTAADEPSPLVVLMSTPRLTPRTNPYATLLTRSLADKPSLRPEYFTWRGALFGDYDVLHLHWPESHLRGSNAIKTGLRRILFLVILIRARLQRRAIVRTVHNLGLPRDISVTERALLATAERWTTLRIRMNEDTPITAGTPYETIRHGHYREWFALYDKPAAVPGRIVFFGLIRRYKSVGQLVRAFSQTASAAPELSLYVGGHPSTKDLADELQALAKRDPRVSLCLRRLTDEELVHCVGEGELVVLPYPEMHNSGAVLTALSLRRPVLIPDNATNRRLSAEVGPGWVFRFDVPLEGLDILDALERWRSCPPEAPPNLDSRSWSQIAVEHEAAYRRAISLARRVSPTDPKA